VDVTIQTSGIMRDMVPNFCELLDRAVIMISGLDEPRKTTSSANTPAARWPPCSKAPSPTRSRGFTAWHHPNLLIGSRLYGLGVGLALDASAWQDGRDLAEVYINWGGHAYGFDGQNAASIPYGFKASQLLADQLARIDVSYMKQTTAEYDLLDCGCYAVFQGGMATAASAVSGRQPRLYWGDSTSPDDTDVRDVSAEIARSARSRLLTGPGSLPCVNMASRARRTRPAGSTIFSSGAPPRTRLLQACLMPCAKPTSG
jgi:cobaltochelatase CobN